MGRAYSRVDWEFMRKSRAVVGDVRLLLIWKQDLKAFNGLAWSTIVPCGEQDNEYSGSIKTERFTEHERGTRAM
jgi:hypothetical protein